jgi:hypothetical protein
VSAGGSQAVQAMKAALFGAKIQRQADQTFRQAGRHVAGCRGERAVCGHLSKLALSGFHHFDDRRYRADLESLANVDHLVVGPTGVFVVDAKNWGGRIEVRGAHLLQDGVIRDERLIALSWMAGRVDELLAASCAPALRATSVACFTSRPQALPPALGRTLLADEQGLATVITARPELLSPQQVAQLTEMLSFAFPPYEVDPEELAQAEGLLFGEEQTRHAGLNDALSRPVEEWMVWLHPEQARVVRRSFPGPARIQGPAGTGKTVVGLHRIAWLASTRPGRFLVTSYVKTLPVTLERSYRRLSPATADRVQFVGLHRLACDILASRQVKVRPDVGHTAFNVAWARVPELHNLTLSKGYFQEEVQQVIKGRDLRDLEAYIGLDRVGRRAPLQPDVRRRVWKLAVSYEEELNRQDAIDMVDVLRLARDAVRAVPEAHRYAGVLVDEVQDLPMVGLQLVHELAGGDRADGLLLVGDGQQAIYPGGFRLREAGVSVSGRSILLRTNYRNTVEVLATARGVVANDAYDDLDGPHAPERDVEVVRHGELPVQYVGRSVEEHDDALLWDLCQLLARPGTSAADVALLAATNALAETYGRMLEANGIPVSLLKHGWGDGVHVGTWARSKGTEFAYVFLPQVDKRTMLTTGGGAAARAEKEELLRRQLFVAMTRARDGLWVGRVNGA